MKSKTVVFRKCVSCGKIKEKNGLFRIVRNKAGSVLLDKTGHEEGRGAYICRNKECFEKAFKKKALERSFRSGIEPEDKKRLIEETEGLG
ncbi:MAG: YlxR family protein [Lachnospiraceae bacterium]|nr:YlxR family protein [Lachnospiraceae bacterium]